MEECMKTSYKGMRAGTSSRLFAFLSLVALTMISVFAKAQVTSVQQQVLSNLPGTWSGTFFPKHSNVSPFNMTVGISKNAQGHLMGTATLNSRCLHQAQMEISVNGPTVVLAGSDEEGDSLTIRGGLDPTNSLLQVSYVLNGSASGRCESETGTGNLGKR
jgi:hypothetical protein